MLLVLSATIGLVAWALHLMQKALVHREFSLMLAGFLVVCAASVLVLVYFMMGDYRGYLDQHAGMFSEETDFSLVEDWLRDDGVLM